MPSQFPQREVVMRRALRRQVLRQGLPLAASREHVENRVQDLADVDIAPPAAALGRRDHRLHQRPLCVAQIAGITQATAIRRATVFRLPHWAPLGIDSGARQRITSDSSDSTTFWIGSKNQNSVPLKHNFRLREERVEPTADYFRPSPPIRQTIQICHCLHLHQRISRRCGQVVDSAGKTPPLSG